MTNIRMLVIDFERWVAAYRGAGIEKAQAERLAMREAIKDQGWSNSDAVEMVDNIFNPRKDEL